METIIYMDFLKLKKLYEENADTKEAEKMAAYMQNKVVFLGLPKPKREALHRQFFVDVKKTDPIDWKFIFDCFKADGREFQYSAMDYLEYHVKQLTAKDIPNIKKLIETKSWWDSIDCLDQIVGEIALNDRSIKPTLVEWSKDKDIWLRRIAIDHQLRFKAKTDTALLAEIIKNSFGSTEFFINKAIGWALREYSKTNPDWVRAFIADNEKSMSKLSITEAGKKLSCQGDGGVDTSRVVSTPPSP